MNSEINLYENSRYIGFYPLEYVEIFFDQYEDFAYFISKDIYEDEVVLYAVYDFYPDSQSVYSADFMMYTMPYEDYMKFAAALLSTSRLFFMRGRKERYED